MTLPAAAFASIRANLFHGLLSQPEVDGINALVDAWRTMGDGDTRKLAYILATAYHETAFTMQPIAEIGKGQGHSYGAIDATGKAPYGRGYVQLTFAGNYQKADRELGLGGKLVANYDLALQADIAAKIIIRGMLEGWFTGKKLSDYFGASADWVNARRIVNILDQATAIAHYAMEFYTALILDGPAPVGTQQAPTPAPVAKPSFWQALIAAILSLFARKP